MAVTITIRLNAKDPVITLDVLAKALPGTRQSQGCRYVNTFVSQDSPKEIVLIQGWDSRADQQRYIAWRQQTGDLAQLIATLSEPPVTDFWNPDAA
jgi:quinol monooxygenase YgiN